MRDHATSSSPSLGVTVARATAARDFDEHERAGLLTPESFLGPALPYALGTQWLKGAVVVRYSGATVRDFARAFNEQAAPDSLFSRSRDCGHSFVFRAFAQRIRKNCGQPEPREAACKSGDIVQYSRCGDDVLVGHAGSASLGEGGGIRVCLQRNVSAHRAGAPTDAPIFSISQIQIFR